MVPAGRRLSRVDSKTLRASFTGNNMEPEMEAVMRNMERKDGKIKYNRRMRYALMGGLGVMMIMVGAMFAVTFSANEATKESHVTGGALLGLDGESVKTSGVKSYGNILGFPCLPMSILETMDEVTMEVMVPKSHSSDGIMEVVMKVGVVERFAADKMVVVQSPSDNQNLMVKDGRATYTDEDICKDKCTVVVSVDVATGRRLTAHTGGVDRSLTAEKPKLATFATFNMLAKVFKQACGAFKTVSAVCDAIATKGPEVAKICRDLSEVNLDDSVGCGEGKSFTVGEILKAEDPKAAYDAIMVRCKDADDKSDGKRQLKGGRRLVANYGWCSMAISFLASKAGIGSGKDSANYCDAKTSGSGWGMGTATSNCCIQHDKCLTCDRADRACYGSSSSGGACDSALSRCAWRVKCSYRCGWRNYGWCYSGTCGAMSTLISGVMAAKPNSGHTC